MRRQQRSRASISRSTRYSDSDWRRNSQPNADTEYYTDSDGYDNAHSQPNADTEYYTDSDGYDNAHGYTYNDAAAYADAKARTDSKASSIAAAATLGH